MDDEGDNRSQFLLRQISLSFRTIPQDKLNEWWGSEEVSRIISDFLDSSEQEAIIIKESQKNSLEIYDIKSLTNNSGGKGSDLLSKNNKNSNKSYFYFIKLSTNPISNLNKDLLYGEILASNLLNFIGNILQKVYNYFLKLKLNNITWSEIIIKDIKDYFDQFFSSVLITQGYIEGVTCLPLPYDVLEGDNPPIQQNAAPSKDSKLVKTAPLASTTLLTLPKEKEEEIYNNIHVLESTIILWIKQMKRIINMTTNNLFLNNNNPLPMDEVNFWYKKNYYLNSIFIQLNNNKKIKLILKNINKFNSNYNNYLLNIIKKIFYLKNESNNVIKYLKVLIPYFQNLENCSNFETISDLFLPIFHIILLIWKSSAYYNTVDKLIILMRELCNCLILQATQYLNSDNFFKLIDEGETSALIKLLKEIIKVFGKFKTIYYEYKMKSTVECPNNPWNIPNNAIFIRFDSFLERCHDLLEFVNTIVMFNKLAKIEIGGTKGKILTASILQIYNDFNVVINIIRDNNQNNLLNLSNESFNTNYYNFYNKVKELDYRLSSIIIQSFEDITTIIGRFRLLDSFDNLIHRPIIADALERKHSVLIESIKEDILEVKDIFETYKENPIIANNLPPIAGALTWSKSLRDRVDLPINKLKTLDSKILDREDTKEVIKLYTGLIGMLSQFDHDKIVTWSESIEGNSNAKLKNSLLVRITDSNNNKDKNSKKLPQLLRVNFDPVLIRLLREIKYFLLLDINIPSVAMDLYSKVEIFRRHIGNLDLIVNMYNDIQVTLLPVERPLVKNLLDRMDKTLQQGIGDSNNVTESKKNKVKCLNWKSNGIDLFINEAMTEVKEINEMLQMLKRNLKSVESTVSLWQTQPLFERGYKTALTQDFINLQKKSRQARLQAVKESGQDIHRLLKDTNKKLKVSQGLPDWKAYVDFINNVVVYGLSEAMAASLRAMAVQFSTQHLESNNLPALIEIQMDLIDNSVVFIPEVGYIEQHQPTPSSNSTTSSSTNTILSLPSNNNHHNQLHNQLHKKVGIQNIVQSWINGMLGLANAFKRIDSIDGTYLKELSDAPKVLKNRLLVSKALNNMEKNANKLRLKFKKFEFLWQSSLNDEFQKFISEVVVTEKVPFITATNENADNISSDSNNDLNDSRNYWLKTIIDLNKFSEKIKYFLDIQVEISDIKTTHDIDFLKVNAQPVKQAISTWVTKWLYMHTQYLQNFVWERLSDIYETIQTVNKGLDITIENNNKEGIMSVLTYIHSIKKRIPEIGYLFEPMNKIVALLKTNGIAIDMPPIGGQPALDFLEHSKMLWENIVNKAFRVKENIQPMQFSMLENVRKEVKGFQLNVNKFIKEFRQSGPFTWNDETNIKDSYLIIDKYYLQLQQLKKENKSINDLEELFELAISQNTGIAEIFSDLTLLKQVWDMILLVTSLFSSWKSTLWADIQTDNLLDEVKKIQNTLKKFPKKCKEWNIFKKLEIEIKNMAIVLPLVHELHSPSMRDRHWKQLSQLTKKDIDRGISFSLEDLLELNLQNYVESVSEIVEVASKELKIETKLLSIEEIWKKFSLQFNQHRDTEILVIAPPDEILETLEEHSLILQSMAGMGKFVEFFREQVANWQLSLGEVESTLKLILLVTRQWGSLESIFLGSADIRAQLPEDTKRFEGVDAEFKEIMRDIQSRPGVLECCRTEGREQILLNMHKELEKCEKALNEYLEVKKLYFPRFYFVSNAALLDILSNGNAPPKIMPHIGSVFDGIGNLTLCHSPAQLKSMKEDPEAAHKPFLAASEMIAKDGEKVSFPCLFEMNGPVEHWLNDLVTVMQDSLKFSLSNSMAEVNSWDDAGHNREEWAKEFPAQIALVTSQIVWTEEVESAMEELEAGQEDAMKKYNELCTARLEGLIRLVQGELTKEERVKIITIITIDVHNRDVVTSLVQKKVESNLDFKWQSQLRYYWQGDEKKVTIRICDFITQYSFEYTGNCGRLVITPLTDRCYVTLTVALRLMMGGAPAGPAGTGKTETTKDLSRGLGVPCYVFNCSDQMNYQTMGDIFKGLTQVGAWGCFDEFNRIEIEVLSVVASQVRCILDAIQLYSVPANRPPQYQNLPAGTPPMKVATFNFFGDTISLVPTVGLFITMNPGYAGRTELPENLKALFRSCAMIQPDFLPICENMLMAEGFVKARPLSVKFVTLYKLSSELLSKQHHYDWGLRAIKSVLRVAGMLKRADPDVEEEAVLMRALRDFNTPKIPTNDIPIFLRLISDLFPSLELATKWNESLYKACVEVCKIQGLYPEETFISKVLQYEEILEVRHSVMLLGQAGCGKSTVWKTLAASHNHIASKQNLNNNKAVTVFETLNPKSVTTDELYGYMTLTKDWKDGLLSIIMRNMSKNILPYQQGQTAKWVVLDGDIDAVWIESMNTVMDDNKVLTLVSNERIPLSESMRMIFEIHSLKNATPATVSRAGILYINDTDIGYQPFLESWMSSRPSELEKSHLPYLVNHYLSKVIEFTISSKLERIVPLPLISLVQSFCFLMEGMYDSVTDKNQASLERTFLYCLMWSFGGSLTSDKQTDWRKQFSIFFRSISKVIKFPESGSVMDFFVDLNSGDVTTWQSKLSLSSLGDSIDSLNSKSSGDGLSAASIVVPTADSLRLSYLMKYYVKQGRPLMFVGSSGTGKTVLVSDFLKNLTADDNYKSTNINMNFYTDSYALQLQLEQHIDKRSGKNYGPPNGKLIFFIDDLNLPFVETYGTQTPIELMRQHIDHGGWFDRNDLSLKKTISDCHYIACMNHKSGSFNVNPRLQRHFATYACQMPSENDLYTIFSSILNIHYNNFERKIQLKMKNIVDATIYVHKEISHKFLPSAIKFHYNFTLRDIASVIKGLLYARPTEQTLTSQISRLWYHEVTRVFSDRLISESEVNRCRDIIVNVGKKFLTEEDSESLFNEPCFFAHYAPAPPKLGLPSNNNNSSDDGTLGAYRNCDDISKFKEILESKLSEYNETYAIMNLVLFEQAIRHILRITRILLFPGGHALLVGVGGSGKQSLSRLAAFICQYEVFQMSVRSDFSTNEFREYLRDLYRKAAIKPAEPLLFLLTDSQIVDERFLVYINDLLNNGYIPDLFTKEDYDGIFSSLRNAAKAEYVPDNRESMMNFFIKRVKANLHLSLCFSPVGDSFRNRVRKFPGIINCTMIDWFLEWPREALVSVAQRFLESVEINQESRPDIKDNIAYHIAEVHLSVGVASVEYAKRESRYNYTTPKSFLELIEFYKLLLSTRKKEMKNSIMRLDTGLLTLQRTNNDVEKLQEFLQEKKKEVELKKAATDKLLEEMGSQRAEAEAQQKIADVEKSKADAAAAEASAIEKQAEGDLQMAQPALKAAENAVNCLDKNSLTVLKTFTKPPSGVDKVTTALLIMIKNEKKDFSWENAKKMMAKIDAFKEKLENYRGEDIPEDVIAKVTPIIDDPEFTVQNMKQKSEAAANLCNWVINIIKFNAIYKRIKPLMDSLDIATKAKKKADEDLNVVKATLAVIESKLHNLQMEFMAATEEKAKVEAEAKECIDRLNLAERLTKGLSSEQERWGLTVEKLRAKDETLPGDVMIAASFTSYLGAFNMYFRERLLKNIWIPDLIARDIPLTPNLDPLTGILSSESQLANWQNEGLPSDRISQENGAILTNSNRWSLLIDPQLQGLRWLTTHVKNKTEKLGVNYHILRIGDKGWITKLTTAITNGDTVIFENVGENLDASLNSILSRSIFKKGKTLFIKVGDEDVEYDSKFQLYFQTKLSNPHYKPEVFAQCTIINFIVTKKGLEDQLLAIIVSEEEPELEKSRNELVVSFNNYKIQLQELEDTLLERLSNAPADILSDVPLIESLEATKQTANEINDAVLRGVQTEIGINAAREVFRVIATEASMLYFILLQLNTIDHMYQYSLDSFIMFFLKALKNAPPATNPLERVTNLQLLLRHTIFKFVNRGLFAQNKLIFLTQFAFSLIQQKLIGDESGFTSEALRFLLLNPRQVEEKSPISWISDSVWNGIRSLANNVEGFDRLPGDIEENSSRFYEWYQMFTPETEKLPGSWRELDRQPFKKLLVIRILRPDRITSALINFFREIIPNSKDFVECDSDLSNYQILEQCFEDSTPSIPLYFILSPGANIASDMDKLAIKYGKQKDVDYHNISLGQGQDIIAEEKLDIAFRQGHWILLNNVHLMPKWLVSMEKRLELYAASYSAYLAHNSTLPQVTQSSDDSLIESSNSNNNNANNSQAAQPPSSGDHSFIHPNFRVFFSSDPSKHIPIGILDRCIKLTSDPPSGLKANLKQAIACFPKETFEELEARTRGILMGLIHFHAVLVERKKFGTKGFNMNYPFSLGDLTNSFQVLKNYMESAPSKVPWADLRYLFGEIMYGGHIVNDLDRLLTKTYLDFYMREELLEEMSLIPFADPSLLISNSSSSGANTINLAESFKSPPTSASYELVLEHIDENFKVETLLLFGLHPNAEIGFRTQASEDLLRNVLDLSASSLLTSQSSESSKENDGESDAEKDVQDSQQQVVETLIQDLLDQFRDIKFETENVFSTPEDIGPFQNVVLQECERMNLLVYEIVSSLIELDLGFKGDLTISDAMEELSNSLYFDRVPKKWEVVAYPSLRSLSNWINDLNNRVSQLNDWVNGSYEMPNVTWLGGLFNPQSFLTCILQLGAQSSGSELDKLQLITDVTKKFHAEEFNSPPRDGAYISGIFLEAASWNLAQGILESARPRELFSPLPVLHMKAGASDRVEAGVYSCPVYKTQQRGPTYVFSLTLRSKSDAARWILAGVVGILDVTM